MTMDPVNILMNKTFICIFAATTSVLDGNLEFNRTSLHQMREAKQCPQACYLWEPQHNPTITMWCKYDVAKPLIPHSLFLLYVWLAKPGVGIYNSYWDDIFFFSLGCSGGNQDQLRWISYQTNILWISSPFWCSCSGSFRWKVRSSILLFSHSDCLCCSIGSLLGLFYLIFLLPSIFPLPLHQ